LWNAPRKSRSERKNDAQRKGARAAENGAKLLPSWNFLLWAMLVIHTYTTSDEPVSIVTGQRRNTPSPPMPGPRPPL
jgi:hypothetical protein